MKTIIVIPARYHSGRFPGKPLKIIKGHSLLYRVWCIAKSVKQIDEVYIATDHADIQSHALAFGAKVIMTKDCENGTARVFDAISKLDKKPEIIFNLQGDAVLTPPWIIQTLIAAMLVNPNIAMTTPATRITRDQYASMHANKLKGEVGGTMVVCDKDNNALYFSKSMIPYLRDTVMENPPLYRHIGFYAYRYATLEKYTTLSPTPLEMLEGLEQLRLLENGVAIRVVMVDYKGRTHASIDSPDDVKRVELIIEKEGELVPLK
ncbi:3-deoxy-manno-octulosonate cytidylyltransferase [Rickettsiella endosymbiont of Dermanyssus gallinae]|uniref:3-deoxy-manno-octulosonate cytidylyltransferase n=1 Tax=Rickettsiella endosymbiont of Dermanyssus gallinae TaxID=2856608 RepID=UPI001C52F11A|nr:3-deoxy-manno-octulosonate cytidylyltransferase [Rickettsiella endosymbiont of Dermanyssus gallinae]